MRIFKKILLLILMILPSLCRAQVSGDEYNVKAMFIFNFTKYINWPSGGHDDNFKIAVLGSSDITEKLKRISALKKVENKSIEIIEMKSSDDDVTPDIIFIPHSQNKKLDAVNKKYQNKQVLIITEDENAALKGSMINFVMVENKLKFELNHIAVRQGGLKVSSQLSDLAIVINQ